MNCTETKRIFGMRWLESISLFLMLVGLTSCSAAPGTSDLSRFSRSTRSAQGDIHCWPPPEVFPTFDKTCGDDSDCIFGLNQTDCCGTLRAIAINANESDRFSDAEQTCEEQYPPCGCASHRVDTEDGDNVYSAKDVGVACVEGSCSTYALE